MMDRIFADISRRLVIKMHCTDADFHKNVASASNTAIPNDLGIEPGLIKSDGCFNIRGKKM